MWSDHPGQLTKNRRPDCGPSFDPKFVETSLSSENKKTRLLDNDSSQ